MGILNGLATGIALVFTIPLVGRILKWVWSLMLSLVSLVFGILDALLWLIGIRLEKKLPVGVIILRDEAGSPLMQPVDIPAGIEQASNTFLQQAKVRLVPVWDNQGVWESGDNIFQSSGHWARINPEAGVSSILSVGCNQTALTEDLGKAGSEFEFLMTSLNQKGNLRRVTGIGAPIIVFIVAEMKGFLGCSLGPLSDYVTIKQAHVDCIAHELGHACNLPHSNTADNLMFGRGCTNHKLTRWQILMLRASRHVSYL